MTPKDTALSERLKEIQVNIHTPIETVHQSLKSFHEKDVSHLNIKDINNVRNMEEGLAGLEKKLDELNIMIQNNNLSEESLSSVRHDMRNSINIMKGYSEIFLETLEEQKQDGIKENFVIILSATNQILEMIELIKI